MPNDNGNLNHADIMILDRFLGRHCPDKCLSCPITGERVPVVRWKITDRLCLVPVMGVGLIAGKDHVPMLKLISPAGGVVLLDAVAAGLVGVTRAN